jgi:hypothetical protein
MIAVGRAGGDLLAVLALPGGAGTADMCRQAEAHGVEVLRFADGEGRG